MENRYNDFDVGKAKKPGIGRGYTLAYKSKSKEWLDLPPTKGELYPDLSDVARAIVKNYDPTKILNVSTSGIDNSQGNIAIYFERRGVPTTYNPEKPKSATIVSEVFLPITPEELLILELELKKELSGG